MEATGFSSLLCDTATHLTRACCGSSETTTDVMGGIYDMEVVSTVEPCMPLQPLMRSVQCLVKSSRVSVLGEQVQDNCQRAATTKKITFYCIAKEHVSDVDEQWCDLSSDIEPLMQMHT